MGRGERLPTKMRNLDTYEEAVMEALVKDIHDCVDPVDQFKLIERYNAFVSARAKRLESEAGRAKSKG